MLRSAAKNHASVTVIADPSDYATVLDELHANAGATTLATRQLLAQKGYARTSAYDAAIAAYLAGPGAAGTGTALLLRPMPRVSSNTNRRMPIISPWQAPARVSNRLPPTIVGRKRFMCSRKKRKKDDMHLA